MNLKNILNTMQIVNESTSKENNVFKIFLLTLIVVQNSATVLVGRYTRSYLPEEQLFEVNHFVMIAEISKLALSCVFEHFAASRGLLHSLQENIIRRPMDALKISIPALLYLIQNTVLYVALSNLSAPLFQVTYQAKLVTTAVVSVIMLGRQYSRKQWFCLVALSAGVATVVLGETNDKDTVQDGSSPSQSQMIGLLAVATACFCSALAGVYFEKVLKVNTTENDGASRAPVSVWMRNVQLSFFSCIIAVIQNTGTKKIWLEGKQQSYFHGFTAWVWMLVVLQAGGGLLVAAVIKHADNVLKGLATGVSVVVSTAFSMVLFGTHPSIQFSVGAGMILISVFFFLKSSTILYDIYSND